MFLKALITYYVFESLKKILRDILCAHVFIRRRIILSEIYGSRFTSFTTSSTIAELCFVLNSIKERRCAL